MTVNCCWLLPNFELYCTKLILRIIPRIIGPITFEQVPLINQGWVNLSISRHFFIATDVKHILAELLIADEPVVDTQEVLLLAFLLERIRDEILVILWLLPVTVPVGSPFLYVVVGNRKEVKSVINEFIVLLHSSSQEVSARAVDDADVPVRQTYFVLCFGIHIE